MMQSQGKMISCGSYPKVLGDFATKQCAQLCKFTQRPHAVQVCRNICACMQTDGCNHASTTNYHAYSGCSCGTSPHDTCAGEFKLNLQIES
mmetsp:Transcript_120553/g.219012  ORF Transcript_120553/g.219012 Transcript_120553/m.219012 type:complete len:91 (+) Transcript_120553:51-323(+)